MMTPEQFQAGDDIYCKKRDSLKNKLKELKEERENFKKDYVEEVFKNSEYKVGDKIVDNIGKTWFVSGADVLSSRVILRLNPPKKDGTMSKVVFIARGEPTIYLN